MKKKITIKDILVLQIVIAIYTLSTFMAKQASGQPLFSVGFFGFYGAELLILGIYALLWSLIWAVVFLRTILRLSLIHI